jgi:carboxymethylenebutenolidase
MKCIVIVLFLFALSTRAFAAQGKQVSYKSGNETVTGMLYTPAQGKGRFPAIVVIHEWWGLVPWVEEQASMLADHGYVALAIDLYRGKKTTSPDEAHELMRGVPQDRAVRDLLAASNYLRSQKNVAADRVGAIGWCMGGGYAFQLAVNDPKLRAVVINYGAMSEDPATLGKIHAAVLGIFGSQDRGIPAENVKKVFSELDKQKKVGEVRIFDDAGHAFENPNNRQGYNEADTNEARTLTLNFLQQHLKD